MQSPCEKGGADLEGRSRLSEEVTLEPGLASIHPMGGRGGRGGHGEERHGAVSHAGRRPEQRLGVGKGRAQPQAQGAKRRGRQPSRAWPARSCWLGLHLQRDQEPPRSSGGSEGVARRGRWRRQRTGQGTPAASGEPQGSGSSWRSTCSRKPPRSLVGSDQVSSLPEHLSPQHLQLSVSVCLSVCLAGQ